MAIPRRVRTCRVRPASRFGRESSQDCDGKGSVLRFPVKNRRDSIVEWHPAQFDIHFFRSRKKIGRFYRQISCKKDSDCFVAATWRGEEIQQQFPVCGGQPSFFQQLSTGSHYGVFVRNIENASRQLPLTCPYGMAILPNQEDVILLVQGHDRNRTAMREILPGQVRIAIYDLIGSYIPHQPLQVGLGRTYLVVLGHIRQLIRQSSDLLFLNLEFKCCTS